LLHDHFLDLELGPIGRVVTSEDSPATAHEFFFWTAETPAAQNLDIGHIVAAEAEDATAVAVLGGENSGLKDQDLHPLREGF